MNKKTPNRNQENAALDNKSNQKVLGQKQKEKQAKKADNTAEIIENSDEEEYYFEEPVKKKLIRIEKMQQDSHVVQGSLKKNQQKIIEEEDIIDDDDKSQQKCIKQADTEILISKKNNALIEKKGSKTTQICQLQLKEQSNKKPQNESQIKYSQDKDIQINNKNNQVQKDFADQCQNLEEQLNYWKIKQRGDFNSHKSAQKDTDDYDVEIIGFKTIQKQKMPYVLFLPYLTNLNKLGEDLQSQFQAMVSSEKYTNKEEDLDRIVLLPTIQQFDLILQCVQKCLPKKDSKSKQKNQNRQKKYKQMRDELNSLKEKQKIQQNSQ